MKVKLSDSDRLLRLIEKRDDGHWIWIGSRCGLNREYGQVRLNGKVVVAHRAAYIVFKGAIPKGMDILHQCGETLCVNPAHVRLGTHRENLEEAVEARGGIHWTTGVKGELSGTSKLTDMEADDIVARCHAGEKQKDLAAEFGITQACVSMIVNGKRRA